MKRVLFLVKIGFSMFFKEKYWNGFTILLFSFLIILSSILFDITTVLNSFVYKIEKDIEIELFLRDSISMMDANVLRKNILREKEVDSAYIINKSEAKEFFLSQFPDISLPGNENPLPISIVLRIKDEYFKDNHLENFIERLQNLESVETVSFNKQIFKKVIDFKKYYNIVIPIIFTVFFILGVFLIFNSKKNSILNKKRYIKTLNFIGVKRWYFLFPFFVESTISSIIISLFSIISIEFISRWIGIFFYISREVIWLEQGLAVIVTFFLSYFFVFFTFRSLK